jgi:hypothetical protein
MMSSSLTDEITIPRRPGSAGGLDPSQFANLVGVARKA